jgi:hypothetical protein
VLLAGIDSGWIIALAAAGTATAGALGWFAKSKRIAVEEARIEASDLAAAPQHEMTAAGRAAEAIASAAATLVGPLQATVTHQQGEIARLTEGQRQCRERERQCQLDLATLRNWANEISAQVGIHPPPEPGPVSPEGGS